MPSFYRKSGGYRPAVLVFSATDGSGGAGMLADCRVLRAEGCLPLAVVTAITAQNLNGVGDCWEVPSRQIARQFELLSGAPLAAVKIGVVGGGAAVVGRCLSSLPTATVVLDPVLAPTRGVSFADERRRAALCRHLLPRAYVATPNRRELRILGGANRPLRALQGWFAMGARHVLVTDMEPKDKRFVRQALFGRGYSSPLWENRAARAPGDFHGSGCYFSSVLAARLALGDTLTAAAEKAAMATRRAVARAEAFPPLGRQKALFRTKAGA